MNVHNRESANQTSAKASAHIVMSGGFGILDPGLPEVEEALSYSYREFVPGSPAGHAIVSRGRSLCTEDFRGRTVFSVGLVPRIAELLDRRGYSVTISDERAQRPRRNPDANVLAAANGRDRAFLEAVARNPLGQIEVFGFQAVIRRISEIANLFPNSKVVVVAGTNRRAQTLHWWLERELQQAVGRAGNRTVRIHHRVIVCSPRYLHTIDGRNVDLVIIPDVADIGDGGADRIARVTFDNARTYLFRNTGLNLGARIEMRCEAIAGPLIFRLAPERAAVRVQICRAGSFPVSGCGNGLERKRSGIWWNSARNDLVARVGDAFARDDRHALWEAGLMSDPSDCTWLDHLPKRHVQILVESTEHARELHRRLPHWCVRECGHCIQKNPQEPAGTIVTLAAAYLHGTFPHVLIRADGADFPLNVRGIPPWQPMAPEGRIYLVDLDDDVDAQSRQDLMKRIRQYHDTGWQVTEGCPLYVPLSVKDRSEAQLIAVKEARGQSTVESTNRNRARNKARDIDGRPR